VLSGKERIAPAACHPLWVVLLAALAVGGCSLGNEPSRPPQLGAKSSDKEANLKLGFPSTATKNTVRVGGGDATADAAGVASALFPATGKANRPTAVVLVDDKDWQGAVTAAVLAAPPIGAPLLLANGGEVPPVTQDTLDRLKPKGSALSKDAQVIRIGRDTARPGGLRTAVIEGGDAYERAAAIDRFSSAAKGKPSRNVIVASGENAGWTAPAAAWAAFSGDSVLLTTRDKLPDPTRKALAEHRKPNIYVLGPKQVVSAGVEKQLKKLGRSVRRIEGDTPVKNAIAFASYERGEFGWAISQSGHNFTVASVDRPGDAAAAATLTARGVPSALLLTDNADKLPKDLDFYLRNVQPGYEDPAGGKGGGLDPRDVAYNRVWILGDDKAVSVPEQARIDEITDLIQVQVNAP
jgi:putative cell wall binding repeat protein